MIDIGLGVVRDHSGVWYRDVDPQATYVVFDTMEDLVGYLRRRHGDFILEITEGLMAEVCRFSVYQRPF